MHTGLAGLAVSRSNIARGGAYDCLSAGIETLNENQLANPLCSGPTREVTRGRHNKHNLKFRDSFQHDQKLGLVGEITLSLLGTWH